MWFCLENVSSLFDIINIYFLELCDISTLESLVSFINLWLAIDVYSPIV